MSGSSNHGLESVRRRTLLLLAVWLVASTPALGQAPAPKPGGKDPSEIVAAIAKPGPLKADLGQAEIQVPAGYRFIAKKHVRQFKEEVTGNPYSDSEVGVILPPGESGSWILFSYHDEGYIKDEDKNELDGGKILKALQESQEEGNKERQRMKYEPLQLVGWEKAPYYDPRTNNLTWSLKVKGMQTGEVSINHEARLLGRGGYMNATLITDPKELAMMVPMYDTLLTGFSYKPGQKYSEWKPGDKVAEYGLMGLIVGGGLIAAAKTGLLGKILKPLIYVVVLIGGAIAAFFKKIFGRSESSPSA